MPIKRLQQETASFPIIGKLRKGGKKVSDKQPGKDLEYFRFDTDDTDAIGRFEKAYGSEPKSLTVYLPFHTIEENFTTWQEEYSAGGLKHRCDGETCVIWQKKDGTYSHDPVKCPGGCKEIGRLTVVIPELMRFAYVSVETHSINDIMQLSRNLNAAYALRGDLAGIPFLLIRRPVEISTPSGNDGKRARRKKSLLFLEPHPEWVQVKMLEMRRNAIGEFAVPEPKQLTGNAQAVNMETGEIIGGYVDEIDEEEIDDQAAIRLLEKIKQTFNGQSGEATSWLIEGYTRKFTPDNIRTNIDSLGSVECVEIVESLKKNGEAIQAKFAEHKAPKT